MDYNTKHKYYFSNFNKNTILFQISTFNTYNFQNISTIDISTIDNKIDDGDIYSGDFRGEAYYKKLKGPRCKNKETCYETYILEYEKNYIDLIKDKNNSWIQNIYYKIF